MPLGERLFSPHFHTNGRWRGATANASLCSSSRWVIYAWRWAPNAPPSLCRLPSARLGPCWDINPSQTPWPTPVSKQTFFSPLVFFSWKYTLCVFFNSSNELILSSSLCPSFLFLIHQFLLARILSRDFSHTRTENLIRRRKTEATLIDFSVLIQNIFQDWKCC